MIGKLYKNILIVNNATIKDLENIYNKGYNIIFKNNLIYINKGDNNYVKNEL